MPAIAVAYSVPWPDARCRAARARISVSASIAPGSTLILNPNLFCLADLVLAGPGSQPSNQCRHPMREVFAQPFELDPAMRIGKRPSSLNRPPSATGCLGQVPLRNGETPPQPE